MPSLPAPTAQKAPGDASADQSSQAVSEAAPTTTSPGNGSKSTGRKELPAVSSNLTCIAFVFFNLILSFSDSNFFSSGTFHIQLSRISCTNK